MGSSYYSGWHLRETSQGSAGGFAANDLLGSPSIQPRFVVSRGVTWLANTHGLGGLQSMLGVEDSD